MGPESRVHKSLRLEGLRTCWNVFFCSSPFLEGVRGIAEELRTCLKGCAPFLEGAPVGLRAGKPRGLRPTQKNFASPARQELADHGGGL